MVKADMEARAPDGPPDLRRRRLRQDRGRAARRVQGGRGRQAGADAGADDDPRPAALRHVLRAPQGLPVHDRARQPLPHANAAEGGRREVQRRHGRHPHRHASPARPRRAPEGPRADHRRRGAALRRQAEGAAAPAQAEGRRHRDERDADPAHAADVAGRPARHQRHRDAARGPPAGEDLRRRVRRGARQAGARCARSARGGQAFFVHNRVETIDETAERLRGLCPGMPLRGRPRPDGREGRSRQRMLAFLRGEADVLVATLDHRVGHRHPAGQHADRRARRRLRPRPALPDPRARRPLARARLRVPPVPRARRP